MGDVTCHAWVPHPPPGADFFLIYFDCPLSFGGQSYFHMSTKLEMIVAERTRQVTASSRSTILRINIELNPLGKRLVKVARRGDHNTGNAQILSSK